MKKLACMVVAAVLPLAAHAQTPLPRWHADLSQGYAELAAASGRLSDSLSQYCMTPGAAGQAGVQERWTEAFMAWQAVRFVEFGPIEQDSMGWQMQFWPDKKNLIARKSQMLLRSEASVTAETLANEGVAVKGFPALEYLLFEHEAKSGLGSACPLSAVIGKQLNANAETLAQRWLQFQAHFESRDAYTADMVKSAIHATEIMRDKRLGEPMGLHGSNRRLHFLADAWRSEQSLATLQATLEGLDRYFMPGLEILLKDSAPELLHVTRAQLTAALEKARALPPGMTALLNSDEGYAQLQSLFISMDTLVIHLNDRVAVELGIVKGFNSSDGD